MKTLNGISVNDYADFSAVIYSKNKEQDLSKTRLYQI